MTFLGMPTAPPGVGQLRQEAPFPVAAARALEDSQLRRNLGHATSTIRAKRAAAVAEVPDWPELRAAGAAIKDDVLAHLDRYLLQLEEQVTARGGTVHWAADANEANQIITGLIRATGQRCVVKVKSMATQEIGLNEALAAAGIEATETDLAERGWSSLSPTTGPATSWSPPSTATGTRSATSSCARCRTRRRSCQPSRPS
jgi:L-lactate dehydrogenase complex protein LldF